MINGLAVLVLVLVRKTNDCGLSSLPGPLGDPCTKRPLRSAKCACKRPFKLAELGYCTL